MKSKKIDMILAVATFLSSALILFLVLYLNHSVTASGWWLKAVFAGAALAAAALASLAALKLAVVLRRRVRIQLPKLFSAFNAVMLALMFCVGFAGQTAYALQHTEQPVPIGDSASGEVVLIIDASLSVSSRTNDVKAAAGMLIDGTGDNTSLALGIFTTEVVEQHPLTLMNENGKNQIKNALNFNPYQGGTSLTKALNWSYEQLKPDIDPSRNQSVVIITDGDAPIYPAAAQQLTDAGIKIYSIRLDDSGSKFLKDFLSIVQNSGGFDTKVTDVNDPAQLDPLVSAIGGITSDVRTNRLGNLEFSDNFVLSDDGEARDVTLPRILIRFACFFLAALIFQLICYRRTDLPSLAVILGGSVLACAAVFLLGALHSVLPSALFLAATVYTVIANISKEEEAHV